MGTPKSDVPVFYPTFYREETLIGEEICDTPAEYWLAETPQTLASRRLGRESAERERIFEINSNLPASKLTIPLS
ncbi:hypothetical protein ABH916_004630 [Peribacillus frigoritolerans]